MDFFYMGNAAQILDEEECNEYQTKILFVIDLTLLVKSRD